MVERLTSYKVGIILLTYQRMRANLTSLSGTRQVVLVLGPATSPPKNVCFAETDIIVGFRNPL